MVLQGLYLPWFNFNKLYLLIIFIYLGIYFQYVMYVDP